MKQGYSSSPWGAITTMIVMVLGIVAVSMMMGCTINPPAGTTASVDTVFGDAEFSAPDKNAAAEVIEEELLKCIGPYQLAVDHPQAKQAFCDCYRRRGQTDSHTYLGNCVGFPKPVLNKEQGVEVRPETPRGGQLEAALKAAEGLATEPYLLDGVLHTGYGHNVQANAVLHEDMETAKAAASTVVGEDVYNGLSQRRKDALAELAFHVGEEGLRRFIELVRAVKNGLFHSAADELMDSDLGRKFPTRASRLASALRNG